MNQDDKVQESILSTVQSTVVHSAQAGLEVARSGIESAKDAAQAAGSAVAFLATEAAAKVVRKPRKTTRQAKTIRKDRGSEKAGREEFISQSYRQKGSRKKAGTQNSKEIQLGRTEQIQARFEPTTIMRGVGFGRRFPL